MDPVVQRIVSEIIKQYQPEKVILFGSFAQGNTHDWSDVDLVAIKRTDKRFYDRIGEVSSLISHNIPIDILVYTPEEFTTMSQGNYFIKNEVIKKGKVIYERSS